MKVFEKNNSKIHNSYELYNQDNSQSKPQMKTFDENIIVKQLLLDQHSLLVITLIDILQNIIDGIQLIFASSNAKFLDHMNQYLYPDDTCDQSQQYNIKDLALKSAPLIICTLFIDILIFISILYFKRKIRNQPIELQKVNKTIYSNQQYNYDKKDRNINSFNTTNCLQIGIIQIRILLRTEILLTTARGYIQICDIITLLLSIFWIVERQNQWSTKMIVLDLNLVYIVTRFQLKLNAFTILKIFQFKYRKLFEHKLEHFTLSINKMIDRQEMSLSKNTQYNTASFQTKLEQQQQNTSPKSKKQTSYMFKYQNSINDIEKKIDNTSFYQQHFQKQNSTFSSINKSPRVFNRLAQNNRAESFSSKISPPIMSVMDMIPSTIMQANMRKQSVFRKVITSDHLIDRPDQNCKMSSSLSLQALNQINQGVLLMNLNQCIVFHNKKILDIFGISKSSKILQRLFQLKKESKVKEGTLLDNKQLSKSESGVKGMSSFNQKPNSKTSQCIQNTKNQSNHYEFGGKKSQQSNSIINSQPSIHEIQGVLRNRSKRGEQKKQTFLNNKSQSQCDFFLVPPKVLFNNNNTNGNNNKKKNQINADDDEEQMFDEKSIREVEEDQNSEYYQGSYIGSQKNEQNIKNKKNGKNIDQLRQSLQIKNKQNIDNLQQQKYENLYSTDEKSFEVIISEIISLIQLYRQNTQYRQCKSENNLDKNLLVQGEWLYNCERTIQRLQDEGYKFNAVLENEQFQQLMNQTNSFSQNHIASANNNSFYDETNSNSKNIPSINQTSIQQINIQIQNSQKIVQDTKQNSPKVNKTNNDDPKQGNRIISVQIKLWNSPQEEQEQDDTSIGKQMNVSTKVDTKKNRKISNKFVEKMQIPMLFIIFEDITQQIEQEEQDRMNRFKLKILSSISHELRTPLNSSMLLLQMLIQSDNLSLSIRQDYLEPAFYNNQLLYFMINDIMDYAQISQNSFQLKFSTFELRSTLQDCLNLFSYSFEDKGIVLSLIIERSINIINSDSERIKQVLINLLSNALKYTTSGSVIVSAIPSLTQKDIIEISVEDTGCGIPPHLHKDIFEYMDNIEILFYFYLIINNSNDLIFFFNFTLLKQIQTMLMLIILNKPQPNQRKQDLNSNGAGLGLTISQKIVRGLSGNIGISLESEEGKGSKFTFYVKNKEPQLSKQAHGKKNNQFNNIFLNWKSMSYTTMQSQEFKSDLSSMKGQSHKSQLTPQHGSSPMNRGSMNFQGSKEENDRKMLLNMYVKRNSYVRKGSKFLEENLLLKDNNGLSSSLDHQYDMYHMNQIGERRNSKKNQNQLFVHYDKPSYMSGYFEQDIESRRNYDNKNHQMRSCDVIESFTELDNYKNQVPALQPFQGHSSIVYAENNNNKWLFNQSQNIPSSPIRNIQNNNKISQTIESTRRKSLLQNANNNITNHDNIIQVNKNLRILAAQEYNQSPNITLKTVKEINDESVDLDSTNNPINTDKNPNSTRKLISKYKQQEQTSPINTDERCQSFTDLDSTRNIDGKDHTFMFQGPQQTSTIYQDTPFMTQNREHNLNQVDSYEQLKVNNQNFDLNNMSFNTTAINIESERPPVINLKQVNDISNDQLDYINEQLSPEKRNHIKPIQDNQSFSKQVQTEIKINNQQEKILKNIDVNNNDINNADMEQVTQQYSNEQLQIKQSQLKKNLQEYYDKKQCKCNQVLVVDDVQFNLSLMKKILASYSVNIDQAVDGKNAYDLVVQKIQSNNCCKHYKLILMDIDMPKMNGYESTQAILKYYKENQKNINPPIISACTAYSSKEDKIQAQKRGMKFFLGKPIQVFHLDVVLEYCLLKKRR